MDILKILAKDSAEYIFNALKIEDHTSQSMSRLRFWYAHCRENFKEAEGDIFEFGVYQGASLLSMALLLKRLGSDKHVYGFDSFSGFPSYHDFDGLENFEKFRGSIFSEEQIEKVNRLKKIRSLRSLLNDKIVNVSNISGAGAFEKTSYSGLLQKIHEFELDNVTLVQGDFSKTVPEFFASYRGPVFSANIDCDLYFGYKTVLQIAWERLVNPGGYIHLDEYYSLKFPGARIAYKEFFKNQKIKPRQQPVRPGEFERWYVQK